MIVIFVCICFLRTRALFIGNGLSICAADCSSVQFLSESRQIKNLLYYMWLAIQNVIIF